MRGTHRSGRTLLDRVPISADIPQETRLAWSSSLTQHGARLQLHRKSHQRVCLVATSRVWPATGVTEIAVPSAPGMWWTSPPELPADSADAVLPPSSLLKAPGKPQTAYTSQGNEINQTKRQFGLINRVSFYTCRLVTSKHYDNRLPAERQIGHTCFLSPFKTHRGSIALAWTLACHTPYESPRCCASLLRGGEGHNMVTFCCFLPCKPASGLWETSILPIWPASKNRWLHSFL